MWKVPSRRPKVDGRVEGLEGGRANGVRTVFLARVELVRDGVDT